MVVVVVLMVVVVGGTSSCCSPCPAVARNYLPVSVVGVAGALGIELSANRAWQREVWLSSDRQHSREKEERKKAIVL